MLTYYFPSNLAIIQPFGLALIGYFVPKFKGRKSAVMVFILSMMYVVVCHIRRMILGKGVSMTVCGF